MDRFSAKGTDVAPLPENNTDRFWLDYTDGQNPHSLQVRFNGGLPNVSNVISAVHQFFLALSPVLYTLNVSGARYSLEGTNISLPVLWEGDPSYGTFAMPATLAPRQICFLGRSSGGRFVRWFVFGWEAAPPTPFRMELSSPTEFGDAWEVISAAQLDGIFLSIDGLNPTLYGYVDVNYNSYFEEKSR